MSVVKLRFKFVVSVFFLFLASSVFAERAHLNISSDTGGWEHLKMGNNPSNVWGPSIDVSQHASLQLVIKDLGGADWSRLQVAPNGSNGVVIGDHFNGNASDWVTVTIPLSAFPASALSSVSHLSLPFSNGANPYAFGLDSATFVGGGQDLVWFDAETKNNNAIQGSINHELIPDDGNGGGGDLPDLRAIGILDLPPGVDPGDVFSTRFRFINDGVVDVGGEYVVSIILSDDSFVSSDDRILSSTLFGNLTAGSQRTHTRNITMPNDVAPGNYRLLMNVDGGNNIVESNENNNVASRGFTVFGSGGNLPDLTISDLQSVGTGEQGAVVSYRFDLNNIGDVVATDSYTIGAFLSADTNFSSNDTRVGLVNTGNTPLGTIQNVDAAITVPETLAAGDYHLIVVADINGDIVESNESNNATSIPFTVTGDGGGGDLPDLRAIGILDLPPGVDPSTSISTRFRFENAGAGSADGGFDVNLILSNDSFVSADDRLLNVFSFADFLPGRIQTATRNLFIPSDIAPGDYRLIMQVDADNDFVESNESNNIASRGITVFGSGGDLPDLTVSDLQSVAVGEPGEIVIYTFDLNNIGDVIADNDYRIAAFLSTDTAFSADDIEAGEVSTGNTPLGTIDNVGAAITVPVDIEPGDYHLILRADVDSEILESNESNNNTSIPFAVTTEGGGGGGDDVRHLHINNTIGGWQKLKIGHNPNNLWGPPISPVNGNTHLEFVVKDFSGNTDWDKIAVIINDRNGSDTLLGNFLPADTSDWFTIRIPLSQFSANIFDDISRIELFSRDAAPWEMGIASITFVGGSSKFVWLGEENNQHSNAVDSNFITTIEVDAGGGGGGGGDKPDLTVSNMSQPASGEAGDVVNFTFNLNNVGDATANNSYFIGAFVSVDNVVDDDDTLAGVVPTGNTAIGTTADVPAAITVPDLPPGNYRLILKADVENTVDEINENNNTVSRSFTITSSGGSVEINIDRTMTETAVEVLNVFTLENVLNQLASQSGDAGLTGLDFWRQFWDTQNTGPGLGRGVHCDDESFQNPTFNGYDLECPRPEGDEVNNDPFAVGATGYVPIALSNRFDLAGTDGSSCGQYRITFARNSGTTSALRRNFVIFEAELPNPAPSCGIEGCRPITDFWVSLSEEEDRTVRAQRLQDFYFNGIPSENVSPVIHVNNYMAGSGQIRTNQFLNQPFFANWQLREYKIGVFCAGNDCDMEAVPVTVKENPEGQLFDTSFSDPRAAQFRSFFPGQVESLAENDLNQIAMLIPDQFLPGQSNAQGVQSNYSFHFDGNSTFATSIQNRLNQLGSNLTPDQIASRATTQSCGGCHQISNGRDLGDGLSWPFSLGFVHTSESSFIDTDGVERHQRSQALNDVFLPHRTAILQDFVDNVGSCAAQGRSADLQSLRSSPSSKSTTANSTGIAVNVIQVEGENGKPVSLDSEALSALDEQRKSGRSDTSMGGPARSH